MRLEVKPGMETAAAMSVWYMARKPQLVVMARTPSRSRARAPSMKVGRRARWPWRTTRSSAPPQVRRGAPHAMVEHREIEGRGIAHVPGNVRELGVEHENAHGETVDVLAASYSHGRLLRGTVDRASSAGRASGVLGGDVP